MVGDHAELIEEYGEKDVRDQARDDQVPHNGVRLHDAGHFDQSDGAGCCLFRCAAGPVAPTTRRGAGHEEGDRHTNRSKEKERGIFPERPGERLGAEAPDRSSRTWPAVMSGKMRLP